MFSLMVSPVSASLPLDNQYCHIVSPYSMIVNSSQNSNILDHSNVNENYCQKKRKLISNSNDSMKLKSKRKAKTISLKKARENKNEKKIINS